jgi:hypothetical protein
VLGVVHSGSGGVLSPSASQCCAVLSNSEAAAAPADAVQISGQRNENSGA